MRIATFNANGGRRPDGANGGRRPEGANGGRRSDGAVDTGVLARACAGLGVDLIGLQEVDVGARRSGRADQPAAVAAAAGMAHAFGAARRLGLRGRFGNAVCARGELAGVEVLRLPRASSRRSRRSALVARAVVAGRAVSVAVAHLSVDQAESEAQLAAVLAAVARRPPPRLVLGDLNRHPHQAEAQLAAAGFALVDPSLPTYPAGAPSARIDHAAVDGLEVVGVEVVLLPVSDHRALVVELR